MTERGGSAPSGEALERFRHIAVEGPIGVGKTTLARRLSSGLGAGLLLEKPLDNPFLDRFYADMAGYAFQTQLAFLFQRVKQMQALAQPSILTPATVSDFMFEKDAIFAGMTLGDEEYRLYRRMYDEVAPQVAPPDLIVWLQAPVPVLLERIRRRAIPMEQRIEGDYLQRLSDGYATHFQAGGAGRTPVLAVDTEHFDPGHRPTDLARLLQRLVTVGPQAGGRLERLEPTGGSDDLATSG